MALQFIWADQLNTLVRGGASERNCVVRRRFHEAQPGVGPVANCPEVGFGEGLRGVGGGWALAVLGDTRMRLEHRPEMELILAGEHDDAAQFGRPHVV